MKPRPKRKGLIHVLPPNENEEAYIEGSDQGQKDKKNGHRTNLAGRYAGEKQCWYVQGYNDGYENNPQWRTLSQPARRE